MTESPRCRVLVVDDQRINAILARKLLERHAIARGLNLSVVIATTVGDALIELADPESRPHVVLLDLVMGLDNGEDVLRAIRRDKLPIRVVVHSGITEQCHPERLAALAGLGADAVVPKPSDWSVIADAVFADCRCPPVPPLRLLIVEDDRVSQAVLLAIMLRGRPGLVAEGVSDVAGAIAALKARPIDVILLDLMLPGEPGEKLLEHLRRRTPDDLRPRPRVIVATAVDDPERIAHVRALGADVVLVKPLDLDQLLAAIGVELPPALPKRTPAVNDQIKTEVTDQVLSMTAAEHPHLMQAGFGDYARVLGIVSSVLDSVQAKLGPLEPANIKLYATMILSVLHAINGNLVIAPPAA